PARVHYSTADGDGVQGRENNEEVHMTSPYVAAACVHKTGNGCTLENSEQQLQDKQPLRITAHRGGTETRADRERRAKTSEEGSKVLKEHVQSLLDTLKKKAKVRVIISGPLPTYMIGCKVLSRLYMLHCWTQGWLYTEDHQQIKTITSYTGESVLLPCYLH
ncbi:hypothetical protein NFI96_028481, partial [Prochilodus magdalenae]